ncbi:DUF6611 family protein [Gordonia soli]|uniref:Uncharacterized protein n=1 Tax=Gordonia soli NBRC 108243 TaxID=1223545 RepID=M0QFC7_9ACTN|nr:DUF6611 family protein [Gordonia soli]GAC67278.1 hypothetical protein GS4_07_00270 [Gordonia soli NBRC 108243]
MHDLHPRPADAVTRVLDGSNRWGSLRVGYARRWVQHRLTVYPPGTSGPERRALRVWHSAPAWTIIGWLVIVAMCGAAGLSTVVGAGVATASIAAALLAAESASRTTRGAVRTARVWSGDFGTPDQQMDRDELVQLATRLARADDDLDAGRITPVEHENVWGAVYSELG